jgi:3-hydroxybutyryl-CoA dehydrogenase
MPERPLPDLRMAILGPGILGLSLAAFAAERGVDVRLVGRNPQHAADAVGIVKARWGRHLDTGRLTPAAIAAATCRLHACASLEEALDGATIAFEALPEDLGTKQLHWARIGAAAAPTALLLTGTSSIPLDLLGRGTGLESRLIGFHLFLPLERMDALELVTGDATDPGALARAEALGALLGRRIFRVRAGAGFAASRMALAQGLEAMRLLERGAASAVDLDGLMVHGYGHPVGPLELSDRIGLDLRLSIARGLHGESGHSAFEPPAILTRLVGEGRLGRKSGRGFYSWDAKGRRQ